MPVNQLPIVNTLPVLIIPFLPLLLCTWIALSRIVDYYHFAEDVVAGILLGLFYSIFSFNVLYLERRWTWLNIDPTHGLAYSHRKRLEGRNEAEESLSSSSSTISIRENSLGESLLDNEDGTGTAATLEVTSHINPTNTNLSYNNKNNASDLSHSSRMVQGSNAV